ncbi:MAG: hypothetical protein ACOC6P_04655 [Candidatus Aminicenantaceae bacterium]
MGNGNASSEETGGMARGEGILFRPARLQRRRCLAQEAVENGS